MKVFISYTRRDPDNRSLNFGKGLAKLLTSHGIDVLFDEQSFVHGKTIADQMLESIYEADRMVLIATPAAMNSKFVNAELRYARDRAIRLYPKVFLHVVALTKKTNLDFLPKDISANLCHTAVGKSTRKLLYEILFSLWDLEIGFLKKQQVGLFADVSWLLLERRVVVEILNETGDTIVVTHYASKNITDEHLTTTDNSRAWSEGTGKSKLLKFKGFLNKKEQLDVKREYSDHRGKKATMVCFKLPAPIPPGEVIEYRTEYTWKNAFDIKNGDVYLFDTFQRIYGYLEWEILLPRTIETEIPTIETRLPINKSEIENFEQVAWNRFRYSIISPTSGATYRVFIKQKSNISQPTI